MHESGWSDVQLENGGIRFPWDPDDSTQREAIGLALYTTEVPHDDYPEDDCPRMPHGVR
jgi:hypothetical protein